MLERTGVRGQQGVGISGLNVDTASNSLCDLGCLFAHSTKPESLLGILSHLSGI